MTSIRLPADIEQKLDALAKTRHKTRSELIRDALEAYLEQETSEKDSYELGITYFGKSGSGERSRSVTYRNRIREKLRAAKHPG
ncbi:MAG: CopG family transcriptional regulator [Spirochaetaceae bacterium]|nr:MAG: CopG family transcriptional regulator [Spirochaetaceae bacterium]